MPNGSSFDSLSGFTLPTFPAHRKRCSGLHGWPLRREEAFPVYWLLGISIQKTDPFCERTDVSRGQSRGNECFHQLVLGEQTAKWRACSPSLVQSHRQPPACLAARPTAPVLAQVRSTSARR